MATTTSATTDNSISPEEPTVQVHESVRLAIHQFLRNQLVGSVYDHLNLYMYGDNMRRTYLEQKLANIRDVLSDQETYGYDLEYLCAVDGLRKNPQTGEPTQDWRFYLDNLKYPLYEPWPTCDTMELHVHAVRQMYPILRNPTEVRLALLRYYGHENIYYHLNLCQMLNTPCGRNMCTLQMQGLNMYYRAMGGNIDRFIEMSKKLGLPQKDTVPCLREDCIACNSKFCRNPAVFDEKYRVNIETTADFYSFKDTRVDNGCSDMKRIAEDSREAMDSQTSSDDTGSASDNSDDNDSGYNN